MIEGAPMTSVLVARVVLAVAIGFAMWFVVGLEPVWWMAWLVPAAFLALILRAASDREARWLALIAALIGCGVNLPYYRTVMGLPAGVLVTVLQALLWRFIVVAARAAILRSRTAFAAFAYPVLWVAADTLMAAFLPDGNWASLGYSQSDVLPLVQVAALFGVPGILFLLALGSSTIATLVAPGSRRHRVPLAIVAMALVSAGVIHGIVRLRTPATGDQLAIGLGSIDDAIGLQAQPPYIAEIRDQYDTQVSSLAGGGARLVLLPEKIAVRTPEDAVEWKTHFGELARRHNVWLNVGIAEDRKPIVNLSWLFDPSGALVANYQKHHLAPPERAYAKGEAFESRTIEGRGYGLAICKDMHFATFGRVYAQRGVSAVLVPAWDFQRDAWMAARMTATRGVEGGYSVIRVAREGLLTVSDPFGRIVGEIESGSMPGRILLARPRIGPPIATLYVVTGNVLGWVCVAMSVFLFVASRRRRRDISEPARS
jgi:apolipoprotein N-acyltransferase